MSSMKETLERLVTIVSDLNRRKGIEGFPKTRPPATGEDLKLMQDGIGARLPASIRQFLSLTNGFVDSGSGLSLFGAVEVADSFYKDRVLTVKSNARIWNSPIAETGVLIGGTMDPGTDGLLLFMDMKTWKARRRECDLVLWSLARGEIHRALGLERFLQYYLDSCRSRLEDSAATQVAGV